MKKLVSTLLLLALLFQPFGCESPAAAGQTSPGEMAANATYKIVAFDGNPLGNGTAMWSGTAWKVHDTEMVTAGHVCDQEGLATAPAFRVYNTEGQSYPATVVGYEHDGSGKLDLCLLSVSGVPGDPLPVAWGMPAYDSPVVYAGAPHGVWFAGMRPIYHGRYAGGNLCVIDAAPGASGSAVMGDGGVIGVLVSGIDDGNLTFIIPVTRLRQFLDDVHEPWFLGDR